MLIQEKIGHIASYAIDDRTLDVFAVEWYETNKRIMRRPTRGGRELALKFLHGDPSFKDGDILYADEKTIIVVEILPCETLVIRMSAPQEIAAVCYEIGNRHLPLFIGSVEDPQGADSTGSRPIGDRHPADRPIGDIELLVPAEEPLFRWLKASGYAVCREDRKLLHPLRSSITAHAHPPASEGGRTLFSRIMHLTNPRT